MAGAWLTAVAGFGGMRDHEGHLSFAPRLPPALDRLAFKLNVRGTSLRVEIRQSGATYTLLEGTELELVHEGERLIVASGVKPEWWRDGGAFFGPTLTRFGPVSVRIGEGGEVGVEGQWRGAAPAIEIRLPEAHGVFAP